MVKFSLQELFDIEKKYNLWDFKLFEYPVWIHCREPLLDTGMYVEKKVAYPTLFKMSKSFLQTMKFLFTQNRYEKVYFLMERAEVLEIYTQDKTDKKILFLNQEQERVFEGDFISSDFFNLLRFISRKVSYLIFYKKYKKIISFFDGIDITDMDPFLKTAFGDALFLKFLSLILSKKNKKYYTGCVVPIGEKFVNALNSYEVQHGVIRKKHIGYVHIPKTKNVLVLYSKLYETILRENGFYGEIIIDNFKKNFFEQKTNREFFIVIYTQPTIVMQKGVDDFFKKYNPTDVYVQKHPKDYFKYDIDEKYFVNQTIPSEVKYPIIYTSTIVENFAMYDRDIYIYDIKYTNNLMESLEVLIKDSNSKIIVKDSLDEIYKEIKERK